MDKKKDDLDLTKMYYNCAPSSQTFGESGEFLRQSNSFKHPSKYFDEGRLFHNASTVSDNVSAIPWKNESPLSEINESMLCDNNMPSQIKKKIFGFSEDQYQKPIDRSDSSKILSSAVHSDYIASLRRVNSQDGRPISTNTSLRSTLLDYESRNSSRFSNPRHSARGKKRTLSASPFSSEIFDLAEIIRTSPNSLVAYVTSNDANGFVSRGSGRNSSAASRASNGSFGHLSIGSVRSSPIGVSKARSQLTVSFDSIHQREKQYNELNQRNQQNQLNQYPLNYSYVQNNSNLDSLTMLLNYQQESSKNSLQKSETQASSITFSSKSSPSDVLQAACKNQRTSLYVPNTANLVPHPPVSQHRKLVNIGDELKNEQRSSLCKDNSNARPNVFIEEDDHTGRNQIEETKPSGDAESEEEESGPVDLCCGWKNCSIKFDSQLQLVHHVNTDHIQKNKKDCSCYWQGCSRGEKSFKAMYMLVVHVRRHTGEKPHKCHYKDCKKAYSRLENLKTHLRSHTGERPYLCEIPGCNKAFSNASDRAKHQNRTHSDVKQYGCKVDGCSKRYTDPSSLRKHMKTVHSVLPQPTKKFRGERPLSGKKPFEGQTNSSNHNTEIRMAKHLKSEPSQNHFNTKKQTPPSNNIIKSTSPLYYTDSDFPNALNEISSHYDISELNYHQPCNARDTEVQLQVSSPRVISSSIKPINLAAEELINQRYSIISSRNLSNRRVSNGSVGSLESNNSSGYESYSNSRRESDMSLQLTGEKYSSVLMNQIVKDVSPRSNAKNFLKELLSETISEDNNSNYFELINRGSCISSGYGSKNNYFPLSKSPEKPNNLSSLNFRRASEGNANRISDIQQNKSPHFRRCSEPVEVTSLIENTPRRHSMTSYNKLPLAPSMNQTSMEVEMKNSILPICQPEENEVQLSRFIQNNEIVMSKPDIQSLLVTHPKDQNTFSTKGSSSLKKQFEVGSRVSDEDFSRYSNVDPLTSFVENYDMAEPNEDVWYDLFHQTNRESAHNLSTPIHSFQNENENNNSQLNKKIDGLRNTYLSEHLQYLQPNYASEKQCNNPQTKNQLQNQRMYDVCGKFLQNKQEKPNDLTLKWRDSHFSRQQTKFDSNAINVEDLLSTNLDALCTETINDGPTTNMVLNTMDILLDSFVEENIFYENQAFRRFSVIYE